MKSLAVYLRVIGDEARRKYRYITCLYSTEMMAQIKTICVFGKCGSGKTTISRILAYELEADLFSAGDFLRKMLKNNLVDKNIQQFISESFSYGMPLNQEVLLYLADFLRPLFNQVNLIFDGFPRNIDQVNMLPSLIRKIKPNNQSSIFGLSLNIPDKVAIDRISSRRELASLTDSRKDDLSTDTIQKRLLSYNVSTVPSLIHFKSLYPLLEVDANLDLHEILDTVRSWLAKS